MAEKKHIQHLRSKVVENGKPKLPTQGTLAVGEIAVNYAEGYETLSIENSASGITTFSSDDVYTKNKLGDLFSGDTTVANAISEKQDTLVSGTNIKTINNQSLLGSGNITISGGGSVTIDSELSDSSENPVQNKVITNALAFKKVTNPSDSSNVGIVNTLSQYYNPNIGKGAVIEGDGDEDYNIQAIGNNAHAEGFGTNASGNSSHAEGDGTTAIGRYSHAEGLYTKAIGERAHAEGDETTAIGNSSHAEGLQTTASGYCAHAEGDETTAIGDYSHAEGLLTTASGQSSHAEGDSTTANSDSSHAEGYETTASGAYSHAEGNNTTASGRCSHAEGLNTIANNQSEHASGQYNVSSSASTTFGNSGNTLFSVGNGNGSSNRHNAFEIRQNGDIYIVKNNADIKLQDALGGGGVVVDSALSDTSENPVQNKVITNALAFKKIVNPSATTNVGIVNTLSQYYNTNIGKGAVIEGSGDEDYIIQAIGNYSHAEGFGTTASGYSSHAEGFNTTASGESSHAEGSDTTAYGYASHAEGQETTAIGSNSHAEGYNTTAIGRYSHAEGNDTTASGQSSHAEGQETTAIGSNSHAEGSDTTASGQSSHAEGDNTRANGDYSHAEGDTTTAKGDSSHAEGYETHANGDYSHAEGQYTATNNQSEHASGQYNVSVSASTTFGNSGNTLFSVGNGNDEDYRHNAFEIRQNGDIYIVKDNTDVKLQDELFSGNYNDLTNKPTIPVVPTNVSAFNNDSGYITSNAIAGKADTTAVTQVNSALTAHTANTNVHVTSSEKAIWNNKSNFSGDYNDLTNKPTIPSYTAGSGITISNDTISAKIWSGTKAAYEALTTKDSDTIYLIYNE